MLPRCVTVVELFKSKYQSSGLFFVAFMVLIPHEDGGAVWVIERVLPSPFSREDRAVAEACVTMSAPSGPFIHEHMLAEDHSYDVYSRACDSLGIEAQPNPLWLRSVDEAKDKESTR